MDSLVLGSARSYDQLMELNLKYPSAELSTLCRRRHVRRLSVFGSAARGEMRTDSDEATLGVASIDLATPAILRNPYRRRAIMGDLQQLYAA